MSGRDRTARWRDRKTIGVVPVTVELEPSALETLRERGVLSDEDMADRHRLAERLGYHFARLLQRE